jgi:sensor domain CHASE-containing protein/GAF domain-containing protein
VVGSIRNALMLDQARQFAEREKFLHDVTSHIRNSASIQSILETTATELGRAFGARRASIFVGEAKTSPSTEPAKEYSGRKIKLMTLRRKTLLTIGISLAGFLAIILFTTRAVALDEYNQLEWRDTSTIIQQLINAINQDISSLDRITGDDSRLDEAYDFALGDNPNFPDNTYTAESAASLRLNLVMICDNSGKVLFGARFNANYGRQPIPDALLALLTTNPKLMHPEAAADGETGSLMTPMGPMLVSSHPIRKSMGIGQAAGTIIFGRDLNNAEIQRLANSALAKTTSAGWNDPQLSADFETAKTYLSGNAAGQPSLPSFILPVNNNTIAGYTVLKDFDQKEAILLRVDLPRSIYQQGQATLRRLSMYLIIAGLAFAGIAILLINYFLITPISRLKENARNLGKGGDFKMRIPSNGNDEIANLTGTINGLLEGLELRTQEVQKASGLQHRLDQTRTAEEICHKIGGILNQPEYLEKATKLIQDQFKLTFVGVYLMTETIGWVELITHAGVESDPRIAQAHKISLSDLPLINQTIISRKTVYEPNASATNPASTAPYLPATRSILAVPLMGKHQVIGALCIYSDLPDCFDEGDIQALEGLADSLSIGIENASSYREVENNLKIAQTLHQQYLGKAWANTALAAGGLSFTYDNDQLNQSSGETRTFNIPLELREQNIGQLRLELDRANLSPEELVMLNTIATDTATALENTRLLEDTQRRVEREQFLAELSNKVHASTDVDSILRTAILELGRRMRASEALIHLDVGRENRS